MKRCPQCEFIYEDDQNSCDMDGVALVFDQPSQPSATPAKKHSKRRSLLSILAVVLGVLVLAIAYASLERAFTVSEPALVTEASAAQSTAPAPEQTSPSEPVEVAPVGEDPTVSMVSDTAKTSRIAARDPEARVAAKAEGTEPLRRNSLGTKGVVLGEIPRQNRVDTNRSQPEMIRPSTPPGQAKKDSKVVSIVKKTGRFFTKPFKL
jgi:cytoskeletal protein RodZ